MNTYLGASAELGPDDVDHDLVAAAQVTLPRGLPLGPARGEGGVSGCAADVAHEAGNRGRAHAVRRLLRRPPPRRVPRAGRATTSTSCSPTRPRSARSTRSTTSTPRSQQVRHHCEIAALTRSEQGLGDRRAATRCTWSTPRRSGDAWSTPPAPATCTPPASCYGLTHGYDLGTCGRLGVARGRRGHLPPRRPPAVARWPSSRPPPARPSVTGACGEAAPLPHRRRRARRGDRARSSSRSATRPNADLIFELIVSRAAPRRATAPTAATSRSPTPRSRRCGTRSTCSRPYRERAQGRDLRLGPHRSPTTRSTTQTRDLAAAMAAARLDGRHRRRPRDHGGGHRGRRARRTRSA